MIIGFKVFGLVFYSNVFFLKSTTNLDSYLRRLSLGLVLRSWVSDTVVNLTKLVSTEKLADKHRTKRKGTWCYWDLFVYLSYVLLDGNQSSTKRNLSQQVAFRVILTKHNCLHLNISVPMTAGVVSLCCLNDVTLTHLDEMKCILSFLPFLYGENYFTAGIQTVNLLIP